MLKATASHQAGSREGYIRSNILHPDTAVKYLEDNPEQGTELDGCGRPSRTAVEDGDALKVYLRFNIEEFKRLNVQTMAFSA